MFEALRVRCLALVIAVFGSAALVSSGQAALSGEMQAQLAKTTYVYIQSQRKDGTFSKPAEIWFFVHDGAVYVASPNTAWRVKRIKAGRAAARIHVDKADGPAFDATGEIVKDPKQWQLLYEAYAKQYPDGWPTHEKSFRQGATDGTRALIKYTPK